MNAILLPNQAIIPLCVALAHLTLSIYALLKRAVKRNIQVQLFVAYLFFTILWNVFLIVVANRALSGFTWEQLIPYGLIILGIIYWAFARSFLQLSWKTGWGWAIAGGGLLLAVSFDTGLLFLPAQLTAWTGDRLTQEALSFIISVSCWGVLMAATLLTAQSRQAHTQNPAHRNRIQFLLIATTILVIGYGMYFLLRQPFHDVGLLVTWIGGALTAYVVVVENLIDLSTAARHVVSKLVTIIVTVAVYIAGIYLVQIFLGNLIAATVLTDFLDPVLLVAIVTAIFLTIVYIPIQRLSRRLTNRLLFGQSYNYQGVIQSYTQAISNILYPDELAIVAVTRIKQTFGLDDGALFMLESEVGNAFNLRTLPVTTSGHFPDTLVLSKETPITDRLVEQGKPLSQYALDISSQYSEAPEAERHALKTLNLEWFVPILKKDQLIGLFALGTKISKQRYSAQDLHLLATLADQTALALENASLVDRLQRNLEETTRMKNLMDNVFDSMQSGVMTIDINNRITLYNQAAEAILHLSPDSIGQLYDFVFPSLADTIFSNLLTNVVEHGDHYTNYEIISELPGRGVVNLNVSMVPLRNAQSQTQGVIVVLEDMTETKRLQAVHDMFRRYVSPAVVDRLPADPSELELGGHRQEITVLFADIRGFTEYSEHLEPEKLVDTLNEYLSMAAASILMYEGTLDKFVGDAVMGIFNAPLEQTDHVLRAVRAAATMQRAITDYHKSIGESRRLSFGIGLHMGEAVVGNVGMSDRMDYTAIGDTVNVAKRIQENTPANKILISEAVYHAVKDAVKAVYFREMKLKGREQPVDTYELIST